MYFRKLNSRLIERRDDSENDSYMSLSAEKQSLQNNSLNNIVHQLRAENLGLWLTRGEQPKHVTY